MKCVSCPFTADQILLQLNLILACVCTRLCRGCFGSDTVFSSKWWPMQGDVWVGNSAYACVRVRVCICVYTIMLLCISSQIKCQQKQLLKFEVAKLQLFSQRYVCFRIQCCISFMCVEVIFHCAPGERQHGRSEPTNCKKTVYSMFYMLFLHYRHR